MDISVIIPVYNVEEYLIPCLDSVYRNVKRMDAEVLLIDDGSTDNSALLAKQYAAKHKKFHYRRKENGGLSSARNYGVKQAKGDYIFFVDSDDIITDGILPKMLKAAKANQTDLTICDVGKIKDGKSLTSDIHLYAFFNLKGSVSHIKRHPNLVYDSTAWNKLIRREYYLSHGFAFPEGKLYEDIPVMLPVHYYANAVSVIRETGYLWRIRTGKSKSITQASKERSSLWDKVEMMEYILNYVDMHIPQPEIRRALENKSVKVDFTGFINHLEELEKQDARDFLEHIAAFVEKNISKDVLNHLSLMQRQMYVYILNRDLEQLNQLMRYKKGNQPNIPVSQTNRGLEFQVREAFFSIPDRGIDRDFIDTPPRCMIDAVRIDKSIVELRGHIYTRRISIRSSEEQRISAYLMNEITGEELELPAESCGSEFLTGEFGTVLNYDDYKYYHYNYDGAGFLIRLDLEAVWRGQEESGDSVIFIKYENDVYQGERILRGVKSAVKNKLKNFRYEKDGFAGRIIFDQRDTLLVRFETIKQTQKRLSEEKYTKIKSAINRRLKRKSMV